MEKKELMVTPHRHLGPKAPKAPMPPQGSKIVDRAPMRQGRRLPSQDANSLPPHGPLASSKPSKAMASPPAGACEALSLKISHSLHRKLLAKAEAEGVGIDEFAGELLAEGLVLRAWEIMERKATMRGAQPSSHHGPSQNRSPNRGFRSTGPGPAHGNGARDPGLQNQGSPRHQRGPSQGGGFGGKDRRAAYRQIMDDNASFLDYVRKQEKNLRP